MTERARGGARTLVQEGLGRMRRFRPEDAFVVCADPRGGSTWLTEVLAAIPRTCVLWEPLDVRAVEECRALGFSWRQHVPEEARWPEAERFFERLLSGRVLARPITRVATVADLVRARRLLVKFTRANALLPWLTRRVRFRFLPVHLVRHPFAVVASQLRHGGWAGVGPEELFGSRFPDLYREHEDYLRGLGSTEEYLTARWCLTNRVPLTSPRNGRDWMTLTYESLLLDPFPQLERVFSAWDVSMPPLIDALARPSLSTKDATFRHSARAQLEKWRDQLGPERVTRMARVLERFEIELYSTDPLPRGHA